MKIYQLEFNRHGYDQYDSFVIMANSKEEAESIVKKDYFEPDWYDSCDWESGYVIEEVEMDKAQILLGSFNAG